MTFSPLHAGQTIRVVVSCTGAACPGAATPFKALISLVNEFTFVNSITPNVTKATKAKNATKVFIVEWNLEWNQLRCRWTDTSQKTMDCKAGERGGQLGASCDVPMRLRVQLSVPSSVTPCLAKSR